MEFSTLLKQNPWWTSSSSINEDPKIRAFNAAKIKWMPRLKRNVILDKDALYSIRGPRQVGKTTLVKLIIREELEKRNPVDIFYFQCDLVDNSKELNDIVETYLTWATSQSKERKIIIIDEITRVPDWQFAYKEIADRRGLSNLTFILTGSSSWDLKHGIERLPGRKGEYNAVQSEKVLLPMKFGEYLQMRDSELFNLLNSKVNIWKEISRKECLQKLLNGNSDDVVNPLLPYLPKLDALLEEYLLTGGIMSVVNEFNEKNSISQTLYELYLQSFFGEITKLKREENTAKKIISASLKTQLNPTGWHKLAKAAGIPTAVTVMDYVDVLQTLFLLNVYSDYDVSKNAPKLRSEKKIKIGNPFFFHAFNGYFENPAGDYFQSAKNYLLDPEKKSTLIENLVGDHLIRLAYTHRPSDIFDPSNAVLYIRTKKGEIDYIVKISDTSLPVEVKYQNSIKNSDFNELKKFEKGILVTKETYLKGNGHIAIPLSIFLILI